MADGSTESSASPKRVRVSLQQIYHRTKVREVGSGWGKVGSCKSPAARKPDTPSSHQPARREVSLLISSFSTSADSQIPPIPMQPAHMRPRHMPSFLDRSLAPLLSKQQAICSLPHGRLRLLRDKR